MFALPDMNGSADGSRRKVTNESVLNFAFLSFVLFVCVQALFALIANSQAMMADCEAMVVDALTYLFNLCAERIKNRPLNAKEQQMTPHVLEYQRELQRLYLELIPPAISVGTLITVTIYTLREAFGILFSEEGGEEEDVSASIMLIFSAANLLLDIVNMTCFAKADSTFGLDLIKRGNDNIVIGAKEIYRRSSFTMDSTRSISKDLLTASSTDNEQTGLLTSNKLKNNCPHHSHFENQPDDDQSKDGESENKISRNSTKRFSSSRLTPAAPHELVNLNMCSAWTHVCADTMRSIAVLIAAALSFIIPSLQPDIADSSAAIVVSVIILVSLIPLIQGLIMTAIEIVSLLMDPPKGTSANTSTSSEAAAIPTPAVTANHELVV